MHDITRLEELGLPAAFVASSEFRSAAAAQSRSLGSEPVAIFVAHPIQDRTDDEVVALADRVAAELQAALLVAPVGDPDSDRDAGRD